jgi:hypothetical protein
MHPIRWIYFADCLQCVKSEYRMESYIHGSEFVVLTNRDLTDDSLKLKELIAKMQEYDIALTKDRFRKSWYNIATNIDYHCLSCQCVSLWWI